MRDRHVAAVSAAATFAGVALLATRDPERTERALTVPIEAGLWFTGWAVRVYEGFRWQR